MAPHPDLAGEIRRLAEEYRPLARQILAEAVRIPADHVDKDPQCGMSNHEGPRVEYLKRAIVEHGAVRSASDCEIDTYGALHWWVEGSSESGAAVPKTEPSTTYGSTAKASSSCGKRVVWFEGHMDTVAPLRSAWKEALHGHVDCYDGLADTALEGLAEEDLARSCGVAPPRSEWADCVFGRGSADQLSGVVNQIVATKIMLETEHLGSLDGVIVRGMGTVAEEDNDGGTPLHLMRHVFPNAPASVVPDVVVLTEGTSHGSHGAVGIYRGHRGRVIIEVDVVGVSCHGSMPHMGLNPLEYGARIITEAEDQYARRETFANDPFLGEGSRTASWAKLDTPSDCAVPARFTFRFDRRITKGEEPEAVRADIEALPAVARARAAGLQVDVRIPHYEEITWKGAKADNPMEYFPWETPADHPSVTAATEAYAAAVSPLVDRITAERESQGRKTHLKREPRVDRWIFSTDGVLYVRHRDDDTVTHEGKTWVHHGERKHPAMIGVGSGFEENAHKVGEHVHLDEAVCAIAFYAQYPSTFAASCPVAGGMEGAE